MSPRTSETRAQSPQSPGKSDADPAVSHVAAGHPGSMTARATTSSSKGLPDYRLRGLDLDAPRMDRSSSPPVRKAQTSRRRRRRLLIKWVAVLAGATLAAMVVRANVVQPFSVPSAGMLPTLQTGDRIIVVKSSLLVGPITRGNIIVFRHPKLFPCGTQGYNAQDLLQRVIGLPGETIWSVDDAIYVNGQRIDEPGWYDSKSRQVGSTPIPRTTVPRGDYFVMGDNRSHSCDSRVFGAIPRSLIVGKVVAVVERGGHPHLQLF